MTADRFSYQWLRNGIPIEGATAASYVLTSADAGHRVSATVTCTKGSLSQTAASAVTAPVTAAGAGLTDTGPATKGISCGFGLAIAIASYSPSQLSSLFDAMAAAGVRWLRWDYQWNGGTTGSSRGGVTDDIYLAAQTAGLNNLVIFEDATAGRGDASSTNGFCTEGGWMTSAVTHLNTLGVHAFEIQNEMNTGGNWSSGIPSPTKYVNTLKTAYATIHSADPDALVLHCGLAPYGIPAGRLQGSQYNPYDFFLDMYSAGAQGSFDASNWHVYCYPDTPDADTTSNTFSNLPTWAYATMNANGDGAKKVWCTEFGVETTAYPTSLASTTIAQGYSMGHDWDWAGPFLLFSWQDTSADGDWGLVTSSGGAKDAGSKSLLATYTDIINPS